MSGWNDLQVRAGRLEQAEVALFASSFLDIFGVSGRADDVLTARVLLQPEKFLMFAVWSAAGSVAMGVALYLGFFMVAALVPAGVLPTDNMFLAALYKIFGELGWLVVLVTALASPIYAMVMALTGFFGAHILPLLLSATLVRGGRALYVAWILWRSGARQQNWIQLYFGGLTVMVTVVLMVTFLMVLAFVWTR